MMTLLFVAMATWVSVEILYMILRDICSGETYYYISKIAYSDLKTAIQVTTFVLPLEMTQMILVISTLLI